MDIILFQNNNCLIAFMENLLYFIYLIKYNIYITNKVDFISLIIKLKM